MMANLEHGTGMLGMQRCVPQVAAKRLALGNQLAGVLHKPLDLHVHAVLLVPDACRSAFVTFSGQRLLCTRP